MSKQKRKIHDITSDATSTEMAKNIKKKNKSNKEYECLEEIIKILQVDTDADVSKKSLRNVLDAADHAYYESSSPILPDPVYDKLRDRYLCLLDDGHDDQTLTNNTKREYLAHVSIKDGTRSTKLDERPLPVYMSSLEKMKNDQRGLERWIAKYPGPYYLRAKLDGVSLLYYRETITGEYHLSTRHDKDVGGVLDPLLLYIHFPPLKKGELVRGELIMSNDVFNTRFKGKRDGRDCVRNSVSGTINALASDYRKGYNEHDSKASADYEFVRAMTFVAYEYMPSPDPATAICFSEQIKHLASMKFEIVDYKFVNVLTQDVLEACFRGWRNLRDNDGNLYSVEGSTINYYAYDTDGVVFSNNIAHVRPVDRNPKFARAFKMDVLDQMADTTVADVEWNASSFGYLKPRIRLKPVRISNATYTYCSGKNAKYIRDMGIGPGAKVTLIRSNDVIPDIYAVKKSTKPSFPSVPYTWVTDIEIAEVGVSDQRQIQVIYRFFTKLGVGNIGPSSVSKLFDHGYKNIKDWLAIVPSDIDGKIPGIKKRTAEKWVSNIRHAVSSATLDILIEAAGLCGRGMGSKRLSWVFKKLLSDDPDVSRHGSNIDKPLLFFTLDDDCMRRLCMSCEGIGETVVEQLIQTRSSAYKWWNEQLGDEYKTIILENTVEKYTQRMGKTQINSDKRDASSNNVVSQSCAGFIILMTGFHDSTYEQEICARGGEIAKTFTKKVNMVVVRDLDMKPNTKTKKAKSLGVPIVGAVDFKTKYMT